VTVVSTGQAVALITAGATVAGLAIAVLLARVLGPPALPEGVDPAAALKFAEGERDRMQSVAKGVAASSAGFLAAVLTAALQGKIADEVSPVTLVLVLLGAVGMLLLAAAQSQASARFMASAVATSQRATAATGNAVETLKW
jgi:hypothetical protein